jgi:MYXO-CTERM domain-containing protein
MNARMIALVAVAGAASLANAQAITGFTGGSQFGSFFGGLIDGDTVGWQFTVNQDIIVTDLGVWNRDTQVGFEGLTSNHQVGIWDLASGALLVSGVAGPSGTAVGDFTYSSVSDTVLTTSGTYVIGALYNAGGVEDGDSYISSATSLTTAGDINFGGARSPLAGDLGFGLPGTFSGAASNGRLGPNFLFRPVPSPSAFALLGLGGLVAGRRRR